MADRMLLRVAESLGEDVGHGRIRLDTNTRSELGLAPGDIVEIKGTRSTGAIVWRARPEDEGGGIIRIDNLTRRNAGTSLGERVEVKPIRIELAANATLAPILPEQRQVRFGPGMGPLVKRGLLKRPLAKGDHILIPGIALFGKGLPFSVQQTVPKGIVQVTEETEITVLEEAAREVVVARVSYEDIGGLHEELQRVREMIELPLKHPELFERMGIEPPKGVLLHGPPGTGKTLIAKAVASESGANFYSIQGPEIMSKYYGESEKRLRDIFEQASKKPPAIVFIDELDSIAPKREEVHGEVERRVVAQLLALMDGLEARGKLIVIGATNIPDAVDPALRRPGRFDREIVIGVPDREGRKEILQIHTRGMPLEGVDLDHLAEITHGFVGADLAAVAREAAMKALRRYLPQIDLEKPIPAEVLERMQVTLEDFNGALREVSPSVLREVFVETSNVTWDDVGGLEKVKQRLREAVEWPLKHPEAFKRVGIRPSRGILLYGPPGTGKTLLAKAVANESEANFIAIKGPEIISKWVGESEKGVRQVFKKAKQAAPCIVFLDELDSLAPRRGLSADSRVSERVVAQLLTSMDGLERMEGVVVIGATNRPDIIDPGLLRAGRFDHLLLTPPPDEASREAILRIHTKDMPLENVDLKALAAKTEGYVGADIESLCREAGLLALRKNMEAETVTAKDFERGLETVKPSVDEKSVASYERLEEELKGETSKRIRTDYETVYR